MENLSKYSFETVIIHLDNLAQNYQATINLQKEFKTAESFTVNLAEKINLEMVSIPSGEFLMGTPANEQGRNGDEAPQHLVKINNFFLGKYPITQGQYQAVMGENPAFFQGNNKPVENLSWFEAMSFCVKLSSLTGKKFRLPTEAEWEYACRAGTNTPFSYGTTITADLVNYKANFGYGEGGKGYWRQETTQVGNFPANGFGLYDLHGNVWEWCADHWHENYEQAPNDGSIWLDTDSEDDQQPRVIRGGSWDDTAFYCRAGVRMWTLPQLKGKLIGFRVACSA